jgi:hypothetical protein
LPTFQVLNKSLLARALFITMVSSMLPNGLQLLILCGAAIGFYNLG